MKIKLDENIPHQLMRLLSELGHSVDSVKEENLTGFKDELVLATCQHENRFLITQDLDFSDIRKYKPGTHAGILLVRLHEPGREAMVRYILQLFKSIPAEKLQKNFIVLTENKIRFY